jgi:hypothetical protein
MQNCKPVFTKHRLIYFRRPRIKAPASSAWQPALVTIAKSQRREAEALCRLITQHCAGAQMLHYLLRWWKKKPTLRMSEADWIQRLGLSKKEIRFGKKALQSAGIAVKVQAHKTGRATYFSVDAPRFIKRLKATLGIAISPLLKLLGVKPIGTDGSVQKGQMGQSIGGQTVITESSTNLSHQIHDDDEKKPLGDSGEFSFQKEGRDEQQQQHDASRQFLEERGVKTQKVLAHASKHALPAIQRAFALAQQFAETNQAGYALRVLENGEFRPKPSWMNNPPPCEAGRGQGWGLKQQSSAVKTNFQKSEYCPDCFWPAHSCKCEKEQSQADV